MKINYPMLEWVKNQKQFPTGVHHPNFGASIVRPADPEQGLYDDEICVIWDRADKRYTDLMVRLISSVPNLYNLIYEIADSTEGDYEAIREEAISLIEKINGND